MKEVWRMRVRYSTKNRATVAVYSTPLAMAKVSVQTPTYVKLDLQWRRDREDTRDSPLFSLELDDEASRAGDDDKTFLPLLGAARKVRRYWHARVVHEPPPLIRPHYR